MKPSAFAYHRPSSVPEAIELLSRLENARVLAGGQSLMPILNMRLLAFDHLVDINKISELVGIELDQHSVRYCVAHDCGRIINPQIVDGQIQGGVAHGIGNALLELMRYDEYGQPLTNTLADYLLPTAPDVPDVEIIHIESPSPNNPLGAKGAVEGGTIPAAAAIIAAIKHALAPFAVTINEAPLLPDRLCELDRCGTNNRR